MNNITSRSPVLEARELSAGYGGAPVVRGINLTVAAGEIVALLGLNGAGKTTTLLTLAGVIPAIAGQVLMYGEETRSPLNVRARRGLSFVTEERSVFMKLTAHENLRLGRGDPERAVELFPELKPLLTRRAGLLSGGEQQMLTLARALAGEPKVLLIDELSLGLAPLIVERLFQSLLWARDQGIGVLIVEQHVSNALQLSDRAYLMARGTIVLSGDDLAQREEEIRAYYLAGDGAGISAEQLSAG